MPTHGSLTKAGKVRGQTPKIAPLNKKSPTPKARNLRNFKRRILGQAGRQPEFRSGGRGRSRGRRR